ncbi:acyl-CoA thioesterase II [Phreatobacter aquaticus]|uniref:Acyl-CoA thioesterase 2 n=1 Tax=Phreatobacter aquaticus TaxID=2570229 RepID=A0A4D7QIC4_9HYPH|nr:acyl-CoA thioesterase II [Phreatobacter aquaticus]QCK85097.1 acyl-CoA thioesterase II [Phreatobacter aquaticus]
MSSAVQGLLSILDLERLEVNLFRGQSPQSRWQRVYGGQVIGQALVAACRTVENRNPHSLHAYFILPGDPKTPIIYNVERVRDGRSYSTRRVLAIQHGAPIFALSASFHIEEEGSFDHQFGMPDVPPPEDLAPDSDVNGRWRDSMPETMRSYFEMDRPIEMRPVEFERYLGQKQPEGRFNVWIKTTGPLPDDPIVHRCVLAYATDMTLLDAAMVPHGRTLFDGSIQAASLDHALWFHRPFRADDWLLYAHDSPSAQRGRGFSRGSIYTRDGTLVASVAQEGVVRDVRPPDDVPQK